MEQERDSAGIWGAKLGGRVLVGGPGWWEVGVLVAGGAGYTHCSSCSSRSPYCSRKYSARSSSSMMPRLMVAVALGPGPGTLHCETVDGVPGGGGGRGCSPFSLGWGKRVDVSERRSSRRGWRLRVAAPGGLTGDLVT